MRRALLSAILTLALGVATACATPAPAPTVTPVPPSATPTATPTATHTSSPTDTPFPTDTPTLTPVPPTSTATPLPPAPTDTPAPASEVSYAVVNVESDDALNVRAQPGVAYAIVGTIPPYGMDVQVTGAGEEVDGAEWVPIRYRDLTGWVNRNYLARQVGLVDEEVAARAAQIIMAIKRQDLGTLAGFVHPDRGVRFSPYTYVRAELEAAGGEDLVFTADDIKDLFDDDTIYTWGEFDGTGEPIALTFREYYDRFIYDVDFAAPHMVGFNETIGSGNTINNIAEVYPQAISIEYHFEGFDPEFAGLDWRSLRLVLEENEGAWYLVGIVHDEWTI